MFRSKVFIFILLVLAALVLQLVVNKANCGTRSAAAQCLNVTVAQYSWRQPLTPAGDYPDISLPGIPACRSVPFGVVRLRDQKRVEDKI